MSENHEDETSGGAGDPPVDDRTARMVRELREEAARRRVENRDLRTTNQQLQDELAAIQAQLDATRMESASSVAERQRVENELREVQERVAALNRQTIEALPERLRGIVPEGLDAVSLQGWLTRSLPLLTQAAPVMDGAAGARTDRLSDTVAVDEPTAFLARQLGVDPQQLAKEAKKRG